MLRNVGIWNVFVFMNRTACQIETVAIVEINIITSHLLQNFYYYLE